MQFVLLWIIFALGLGPLWARYLALMSGVIFSFVDFDYIFGDYSYSKLRLKGFYESNNKKAKNTIKKQMYSLNYSFAFYKF